MADDGICLVLSLLEFRLGLAYAGSNREDVLSLLLPVMGDSKSSMEVRTCMLLDSSHSAHTQFKNIPCVHVYIL